MLSEQVSISSETEVDSYGSERECYKAGDLVKIGEPDDNIPPRLNLCPNQKHVGSWEPKPDNDGLSIEQDDSNPTPEGTTSADCW